MSEPTEDDDLPVRPYDLLSEEHKRQVCRFQKRRYDPEQDARDLSLWQWGYTKFSKEARENPDSIRAIVTRRYAARLKEHPQQPIDP